MTFAQYLMLAAAVSSALAWRWNATCAALALSYFAVQAWWMLAGVVRPGDLFMVDTVTILLIYCKAVARDTECIEYRSVWHQLQCFILAPTFRDRLILVSFPVAVWPAYVLNIGDFALWWWLYGVSLLQFLAAGSEAFHEWRKAKAPLSDPGNPSSGLMFAWAGVERWST